MRFEKILIALMVLTIFLDDFRFGSEATRGAASFDFYYYYVIWAVFLLHYVTRLKSLPIWPGWFLGGILVLFTNSVIGGSLSDSLKFPMLKQMLGITYSSVAYFALVKYTGFDLKRLFRIYLTASFWVSIWGLAEEIMRVLKFDQRFPAGPVRTLLELLGFTNLWDNHKAMSIGLYRVYSIMGEPYFLAVALLPALYYLFNCMIGPVNVRDWKEKWRFIVVLGCYLLTFSTAGYTGIMLSAGMVAANWGLFNLRKTGIIFIPILLFVILPRLGELRNLFFELQVRVDDTVKAFVSRGNLSKNEIAKLNSSTFALYSNFLIAGQSFENYPITGAGLGSHEISYERYFDQFLDKRFKIMYGKFNTKDANSLFIRLLSEGGLIGLGLLFVAIFGFFIYRRGLDVPELSLLTIINQGVFLMMIVRILRTGNYIGQGFYFFFFLYAFSAIAIRSYYRELGEKEKRNLQGDSGVDLESILEA